MPVLLKKSGCGADESLLHPRTHVNNPYGFFAALAFGLAAAAAGEAAGAVDCGIVVAALTGGDATVPGDAGRSPRLLGLFSIVFAMLLMILDSFMATSSSAALRISDRCLISAWVIC